MGGRQSDGRIVPLIATNNAEGKPRERVVPHDSCHAKQYQEGNITHTQRWNHNGNITFENSTIISRKTAFGKAAGSAINKVGSSAGKVLNKASEKISNIKVGRQTLGEVANKTVKSSVDEFLDDPSGGRDSGTMSFLSDIASKIGGGNKR